MTIPTGPHRAGAGRDGDRWCVDVGDATDVPLCGGKAVGLARLERAGFAVPAAICLTTEFYQYWLDASGVGRELQNLVENSAAVEPEGRPGALAKIRDRIELASMPDELMAELVLGLARLAGHSPEALVVRSSAPYEDDGDASHAGIHSSTVVGDHEPWTVIAAVKTCWASLWTDAAWAYRERIGIAHASAAMAVVVQRLVDGDRSGVAFSADPLTDDPATVVIDAGWGMGAALVSGKLVPDEYRVALDGETPAGPPYRPGRQETMTSWRDGRAVERSVPDAWRGRPVLSDTERLELARLVKAVEHSLRMPVDVEWTFDGRMFWAVQARPITGLGTARHEPAEPETMWTRANLKEVFPELPSPLALSYLSISLNLMFKSYHAGLGYRLPVDAALVSVFRGRPYLNLSLMQRLAIERGGDPSIVARLFGGAGAAPRPGRPASAPPRPGIRDRLRLVREMLATFFRTPARGRRLFRALRREAAALRSVRLEQLDDRELVAHLGHFRENLLHETTARRLHEVVSAQSRAYMALDELLAAWIPSDADALVKRLMTGLGTLPNVRMTYRLMALGAEAIREPRTRSFFAGQLDADAIRDHDKALAGTRFLEEYRDFLREFGHRGPYESDVMSPRFADDPAPLFRLIQLYVRAGAGQDAARHVAERRRVREAATDEVRQALRRGRGRLAFAVRWTAFSIVRDALQRLLALRDECRHVTTMLVAHLRRVALEIGRRATRNGLLASREDVFFLSWEELPRVLAERDHNWRAIVAGRRRERERNRTLEAPDLLGGGTSDDGAGASPDGELAGLGVSAGVVSGTIRVLRSGDDVRPLLGEIVVLPTMEPTLTPIFPLVGGLITEMGGLLSHAAILAREYGLPAVVGVQGATRRLHDGDRVELNGTTGRIRLLGRAT
ncbi:MAG TPA: PEP/pyruvate-binding domain-containing protein [Candidatus Nitrosotalea sp.]|nr:PEP/pyruvate-binding domain-containing protein [Candidatus Nitrosotalea sp.]